MANGIDPQYTGIGRVPIIQEETTSIWDAIVPLAQMVKADTARKEKLKLDYAALQQKRDEADDLNQYRQDSLDQQSAYQKGQLDIAQERNQIAKMEFEKKKQDENEADDLRTAQSMTNWQDKVSELRRMGEEYGKDFYLRRADQIEKDGVVKDGMLKFKNNMYSEDNPYKIDEYLRREGEDLQKHYPGAFEYLNKRSTDLKKQYSTSDAAVQNSVEYKGYVNQIKTEMGEPGAFQKNPQTGEQYTMEDYNAALAQARMNSAHAIQAPLLQAGIAPTDDADMDKIWENPEAREAYFANPLDDTKSIMKKFGMIEDKEEGEKPSGVDDKYKDDTDKIREDRERIAPLEAKARTYEESGLTNLAGYEEVKKALDIKQSELDTKIDNLRIKKLSDQTGESEEDIRKAEAHTKVVGQFVSSPIMFGLTQVAKKVMGGGGKKESKEGSKASLTPNQQRKIRTNLSRISSIKEKNFSKEVKDKKINIIKNAILKIDPNYKF